MWTRQTVVAAQWALTVWRGHRALDDSVDKFDEPFDKLMETLAKPLPRYVTESNESEPVCRKAGRTSAAAVTTELTWEPAKPSEIMSSGKLTVDAELEKLQCDTFGYFLHETNPVNGLVIDQTAPDWLSSVAATGLAFACYPVSVERGLMSRAASVERMLATLHFFWNSPQGPEPDSSGFQGFYYHFLDMQTGRRAWQYELSTVDTAFLLAGALTAAVYFDLATADEHEIRTLADALYRRADWKGKRSVLKRILMQSECWIVGDDQDIRRALHELLESQYYMVKSVGTDVEAFGQVWDQRFGVVILDLELPDVNRLEVL